MGLIAPPTTSTAEARSTWVYLTQHLPFSTFLTPSRVCFSRSFAALFRAAAAPGVFASRAFPTRTAGNRLRPRPHMTLRVLAVARLSPGEPCAVSNAVPRAPRAVGGSTTRLALPTPVRVASWVYRPSVRTDDEGFSLTESRCSPGVSSSKARHSTRLPSTTTRFDPLGPRACQWQHPLLAFRRMPVTFRVLRRAKPGSPFLPKQRSGTQPSWSFSPLRTQ